MKKGRIVLSCLALVALAIIGFGGNVGHGSIAAQGATSSSVALSQYGGNPGLEVSPTGYFSTAFIAGHWWLTDPDGNAFYVAGVNQVNPDGISSIIGTNPYGDAMKAKYGDPVNKAAWSADVIERLKSWGYNSVGPYSDESLFARIPHAVVLSPMDALRHAVYAIHGSDQDVYPIIWEKSQWDSTYRRYFFDVFNPLFDSTVKTDIAAEISAGGYINDRWLIGYMADGELPVWYGRDQTPGSEWYIGNTLADVFIALPATADGKKEWVRELEATYQNDISALNGEWSTNYSSFDDLLTVYSVPSSNSNIARDKSNFLRAILDKYYGTVKSAIRAVDPNHLYLGSRLIIYAVANPPEVYQEIAKYADVVSVNYYVWQDLTYDQLSAQMNGLFNEAYQGKPLLITEYSFGGSDSGMPATHPNGAVVGTQAERARLADDYQHISVDSPYLAGDFWWDYNDPPAVGSSWGDEDSNLGLVDSQDFPYLGFLYPASQENADVYALRGLPGSSHPVISSATAIARTTSVSSLYSMAFASKVTADVLPLDQPFKIYLPAVFKQYTPAAGADFVFSLSQPVTSARLEIYSGNGAHSTVQRVITTGALAAGQNRIGWDGKSDYGSVVGRGTYYFVLKVTAGNSQSDYAFQDFTM